MRTGLEHPRVLLTQGGFTQGSFDFPRVFIGSCDFSQAIDRFFLKKGKCATLGVWHKYPGYTWGKFR
jgi:hypothetical protein